MKVKELVVFLQGLDQEAYIKSTNKPNGEFILNFKLGPVIFIETKACAFCGAPIDTNGTRKRYCNLACKQKDWRQRQNEKYRE